MIRDNWEWFAYWLTLLTVSTGLITFAAWLNRIRRRPELRFLWSHGTGPDDMQEWEPGAVLDVHPKQQLYVSAAFQNVGDATADHIVINFLVPQPFELQQADDPKRRRILSSGNPAVGEPSEGQKVRYYYAYLQPVTPGNYYIATFIVDAPDPLGTDHPQRVMFEVSSPTLNRTGKRHDWSRLTPIADKPPAPGEEWPGEPQHEWRRPRALPDGHVRCTIGARQSIREVRIVPPKAEED